MKFESQLQIVTAAGVPPLTVNQNALVTNFNADLLDGQHASYFLDTSSTAQTKSGSLYLGSTLQAGFGRLKVFDYNLNNTPTNGIRIATTIPQTSGVGMYTLIFEGYRYGDSAPEMWAISFYPYNTGSGVVFINYGGSCHGGKYPTSVQLGWVGGFANIFILSDLVYYRRFAIRAVAGNMSESTSHFEGWVVSDSNPTLAGATGVVTVPFNNEFGNVAVKGTLSITSTGLVSNLNADYLDGQHGSYYENRDTTAVGFSAGTLTLTRAAGNLTVSLDGRYLPLTGGTVTGQLAINGTTASDILRLYTTGSTIWKFGVTDASGSYLNITADFGNVTIYKLNGNITTPGAFVSTVATGTAPLSVTSTTAVANLNSDLLDGQHASYFENRDITAVSFASGSLTFTRAAGNLSISMDGRYVPISGGTMTGSLIVQGGNASITASHSGNAAQWYGKVATINGTSDEQVFLGTYGNIGAIACVVNSTGAWNDLYVNTVDGSTGGTVRMPSSVLINGNQALHAGNYSSYALPLSGGTMTGDLTATRIRGVNSLVLNTFTTVNPASNVFLYSQPNDRDAWIFLDSADTTSNWGIYHRQIDSAVSGLPANSIGFIGGGSSALQAWISLANGSAGFTGTVSAGSFSGPGTGLTGTAASLSIGGNAATASSATRLTNLTSTTTSSAGTDNSESCVSYLNGISLFGQTDGALYSHVYSASWKHNIYGDYRTGQLAVRGKNNGTWQAWRAVLDSSNVSTYALPIGGGTLTGALTGTTAAFSGAITQGGNPVLSESVVTFTPTTVGWYRIANAGGNSSGTIRINGFYDNRSAVLEFDYTVNGWNQGCSINLRNNNTYAGSLITQIRASNDVSTANGYLDIYIATATTPGPLTIYNFGPARASLVASPVVGAVVGTNVVKIANINNVMGFVTTGPINADTMAIAGNGTIGGTLNITGATTFGASATFSAASGTYINTGGGSDAFGYNATAGRGHYIKGTGNTYIYGGGVFWDGSAIRTLLHSNNFSSYALPITGGTLTGELTIATGAASGLRVNSPSGTQGFWLRVGYDTDGTATPVASALNTMLQSSGSSAGTFTIVCGNTKVLSLSTGAINSLVALQQSGNQVLHAGNYSSYRGNQLVSPNGGTVVAADSAMPDAANSFIHTLGFGPSGNDGHILGMTWTGTSVYGAQIWIDTDPTNRMAFRSRSNVGVWTGWNEIIHSSNYSSYALPLSGGTLTGALSGTSASFSGALSSGGNSVLTVGNYSSYAVDNTKRFKQFFWDGLSASTTQARRFEIARISVDTANWNATGTFEVEVSDTYYDRGLKKRYVVWYGYNIPKSGIKLVEMIGAGDNNYQVTLGTPQPITGYQYYLPVYVDVRYYGIAAVRVKTSHQITSNSTPPVGYAYINSSPTPTNITDFTADSTVDLSNAASAWQVGGNTIIHSGNYTSYPPARWATGRSISLTGDVTGTSGAFDGTANLSFAATLANSGVTAGTYRSVTVDAKGRVTAGTNPTTLSGYGITDIAYGSTGSRNVWTITDWNQTTYQNAHFLSSENTHTNGPSSDFIYGLQTSFHRSGAAYRTQMVTELYSSPVSIWVRNSRDSDVWTTWSKLLHSNNYNSYVLSASGTAASLSIGGSAAQLNGQAASYYENRDTTAVGFSGGTLTLTRAAGNLSVSLDGRYLTGNQTITLGGDLSGSGSTSISATIGANAITTTKINNSAVTYAKIQNVGAASVLGNPSASVSQAPQEITFANLGPYINGVARAWVTFNENPSTGAITINASFGISSVTRLAAGVYQVNFSTAFSDTHYAVSGTIGYESISAYTNGGYLGLTRTANPKTTTSCEVAALYGGTNYNARYVHVVFHR